MTKVNDPAKTRAAVLAVRAWVEAPDDTPRPARPALADAVRRTARALAHDAPGHSVELRVPPFVAVQCIDGPQHTRGNPPNVVETDPLTWLRLATGDETWDSALASGRLEASGSRAAEIAAWLPVVF